MALCQSCAETAICREVFNTFPGYLAQEAASAGSPPTVLARAMSQWIRRRQDEGVVDSYQAIEMERAVNQLIDNQGGCERIQKTPLPFVYAAPIKQILLVYLGTLPFVLVDKMGFAAPLVVATVSLGMLHRRGGRGGRRPILHGAKRLAAGGNLRHIARDSRALCGRGMKRMN